MKLKNCKGNNTPRANDAGAKGCPARYNAASTVRKLFKYFASHQTNLRSTRRIVHAVIIHSAAKTIKGELVVGPTT